MSYINNKNTPSYVRPPRTQKFVQCYCSSCKGKLVNPRTKKSHYAKKDRIVPQREAIRNSESKNQYLLWKNLWKRMMMMIHKKTINS
ncbi:unnamed protein product [Rhizophagus irregularis]|nr:unnamed protein product [Rhizophagus irregularis]